MKNMAPYTSNHLEVKFIPESEFYSQVIECLQDYSIITINNALQINSWSSGAISIFGYSFEEIIGKPFDIIYTEEDKKLKIPEYEIETADKAGRAVDNRWHVCKDGSKFFAYGLVFPLTDTEGNKIGYVKILRDITERKKNEDALNKHIKELKELNAHKESILAILSHDLRSPLARIISIADYLKNDIDKIEPSEVKQMLNFLSEATKDELNMLDYLVEWARIKYASQTFTPAKIDINQYVLKVFDTLAQTAAAHKIKLQSEIELNITAYADGKMILSALQNIISNAIKHSNKEGIILVTAVREEDNIIVEVKDTGIGMSSETQENIFTPHLNILLQPRSENKGAGIGLLLTKSFIEKNLGKIWVKSVQGVGTSFYFSLPASKPAEDIISE